MVRLKLFTHSNAGIEKKVKDKRIIMAQWVNRLRNNGFVNATRLPLLHVLNFWSRTPSATGSYVKLVGWLAGRRNPCDFRDFQNSL